MENGVDEPPPWICTMTGRFADTGALGVITSSIKQSSSPSTVTDEADGSQAGVLWMHEGPCTVALRISGRGAVWVSMGTGALQRKCPTGAFA